ncbi:hypothetical protein [Paracoccus mutanolyticus]|uniref:hypothetical protein n=1 Tax=Paracoccus mutanolyticus TaxID=1499308 RepID=UPI00167B7067|nr:hypothetical protein [Paracoccus mutanolyticus]
MTGEASLYRVTATDDPAGDLVRQSRHLLRLCTAPHPADDSQLLFLPAALGFRSDERVVINPSYYMPR